MLSVVVPTYNERENIPVLLDRLASALDREYEVLVVDDDSPDETWRVAEQCAESHPVRAIHRTDRQGLATAVLDGIDAAGGDIVVVMDADLQHPPERVPALVAAVEDGADIAVGSRFVEGGSVGDFGQVRYLVSKGADLLARTLFPAVRGIGDIQSGFFALRPAVVADADLQPTGYKILLEILVCCSYETVVEVGYEFGERNAGESKLGLDTVVDYLRHLWTLWRRT
jgi:dolichol-phosphate mannosyltransferase